MPETSALHHNAPFRRLVAAVAAGQLSSAMAAVVVPLLILVSRGSPSLAGLASGLAMAASVVGLTFSGTLVDRWSPVSAFRLSSLVQAVSWGCCAVVWALGGAPVWLIVTATVVASFASSLDAPSDESIVKKIIPQEQLGQAAAVSQGREAAAGLLGGPLGGALFGVSVVLVTGFQTVLHIVACLLVPPVRRVKPEMVGRTAFWRDMTDGFAVVFRRPALRDITIVASLANLPMAALPMALTIYFQQTGRSNFLIGVLASAFGLGILVGSFLAGPLSSRFRLGQLAWVALGLYWVISTAVIISYPLFWVTCLLVALAGVPLPAFNSAIGAYTTATTSSDWMGRVVAATGVPGIILMPLGPLVAGVAYQKLGMTITLGLISTLCLVPLVIAWASPHLRQVPQLRDLEEAA